MKKKIIAIMTVLCLLIGFMPVQVVYAGEKTDIPNKYVILFSGDGTGDYIRLTSRDEGRYFGMSNGGRGVSNGQFYEDEKTRTIWFMIPDCPESFNAPEGCRFKEWDNGLEPGDIIEVTEGLTLTAIWEGEYQDYEYFTITPTSYTITNEPKNEIPFGLRSIGDYKGDCIEYIRFTFKAGVLKDTSGNSIPFRLIDFMNSDYVQETIAPNMGNDLKDISVEICMDDVYQVVYPGTYSGKLEFDTILGLDTGEECPGPSGSISLTYTKPGGDQSTTNPALPPEDDPSIIKTKTAMYRITDEKKQTVKLVSGTPSAKGALTIPKTVKYDKKTYKVTEISGGTFDGMSELKTVTIKAGNLKKIGEYAFRFINKKAVFKIKGTKAQFKKIKKLIKSSKSVPKSVKYKRVK